MPDTSLKQKVVKGVVWRLITRLSTQGVSFIISIVLARLLGPEAYGIIALQAIFISFADVIANAGFGVALVQRKDITAVEMNSAFYLQMILAVVMYLVLFMGAPYIAAFYERPLLINVLRVQALILPINAIRGIQSVVLSRELKFYLSFRIGIAEVVASGIVGLSMAYLGLGVWALVFSTLSGSIAGLISAIFAVRWLPRLLFSWSAVRGLFDYGWKMLASSLLDSFFSNLYGLVIGRFYTPTDLALYNRGRQIPSLAMDTINSSLSIVAFPALSKVQMEPDRMKNAMRKMIQVSTFFVMPMLAGMSAVAEPFIRIILGESWRGAAIYVSIACVSFAFYPFHTINLQAIKAIGRSDYYLGVSVIKDILSVVVLFIFCRYGVVALALAGAVVSTPLGLLINSYPNKKLLRYGISEQLFDVVPILIISLIMAILVWLVRFMRFGDEWVVFGSQIILGVIIFYVLIVILRPRALYLVCEGLPVAKKFLPKFVCENM